MSDSATSARAALFVAAKAFLTTGDSPTMGVDAIEWPNKKFDPKGKGSWAKVSFVPNDRNPRTIGNGGQDLLTGFLQIDLNFPMGSGEKMPLLWEAKAELAFVAGKVFNSGGVSTTVIRSEIGAGRNVENYFRKTATLYFRTHLTRANI